MNDQEIVFQTVWERIKLHFYILDKKAVAAGFGRPTDSFMSGFNIDTSKKNVWSKKVIEVFLGTTAEGLFQHLWKTRSVGMSKLIIQAGLVDIDHILPKSTVSLSTTSDTSLDGTAYLQCFDVQHFTNLRLEWRDLNGAKGQSILTVLNPERGDDNRVVKYKAVSVTNLKKHTFVETHDDLIINLHVRSHST